MKRFISVFCIITLLFLFTGCGKKDENKEYIEPSELTQAEIDDAIETATKYFNRNFKRCTLKEFIYDKEQSRAMNKYYIEEGKVSDNRGEYMKVIFLNSEFHINSDYNEGDLKPDSDCFYHFTLTRQTKNGKWKVKDFGYC